MEAQLARMGLTATWITEFDRDELSESQIERFVDPSALRERAAVTEVMSGGKAYPAKPLKPAEISIALKQLEILKHHAESSDGYVVVLEDDVTFKGREFRKKFSELLQMTPPDWDFIFFGESGIPFEKNPWRRAWNRLSGRRVFQKRPPSTRCLDSYAVTTRAAQLLARSIDRIALPIDWELNYWIAKFRLKVFWWEPGLTVQGSQTGTYKSSIR